MEHYKEFEQHLLKYIDGSTSVDKGNKQRKKPNPSEKEENSYRGNKTVAKQQISAGVCCEEKNEGSGMQKKTCTVGNLPSVKAQLYLA